jgi:hypothetical protein
MDDVLAALTKAAPGSATATPVQQARGWVAAMRHAETGTSGRAASGRFITALEELFRLPMGYFRDPAVATATDARIMFASNEANTRARVIGPCRVLRSEIPAEQLHALQVEVIAALRLPAAS